MGFFNEKNIAKYLVVVGILMVASYVGSKFKNYVDFSNDDEMIRKYLLNDNVLATSNVSFHFTPASPLYQHNRPKLWIHTKYEYNSRMWASFGSRSSFDLNQPYIHLTVRSIIHKCGKDFDICLIDDDSFRQLVPNWTTKISEILEPYKSHYRDLAFAELLYVYGGILVPNSFICLQNLFDTYQMGIQKNKPFLFETVNRRVNTFDEKRRSQTYCPDIHFMGTPKRNPTIRQYADFLKSRLAQMHSNSEDDLRGIHTQWWSREIEQRNANIVDGVLVGIKSVKGKPILLEDMMEDRPLDICPRRTLGIVVPMDELLKRNKYNWFAVMSMNDVLKTNTSLAKYMQLALMEDETVSTVVEETPGPAISL